MVGHMPAHFLTCTPDLRHRCLRLLLFRLCLPWHGTKDMAWGMLSLFVRGYVDADNSVLARDCLGHALMYRMSPLS